jgi:hypothetical protein
MRTSQSDFIEKLGKIIDKSDRMLLVVNDAIEIHAPYFNYSDVQKLTYLLQRTSCDWYFKPVNENLVKLRIILF